MNVVILIITGAVRTETITTEASVAHGAASVRLSHQRQAWNKPRVLKNGTLRLRLRQVANYSYYSFLFFLYQHKTMDDKVQSAM